jgi:hypothetical protein
MMINAAWADFEALVVPANAAEFQRQEMRRAFYAGAAAVYGISLRATIKPDGDALADIRELRTDLENFQRKISDGF